MQSIPCEVLIIGGGATGAGILFDLAQRGLKVVLVEQNDLGTGTSGRYHGLLHSGARYVVRDPASAKECIDENRILRRIAPHVIEDTGGWFAAFAQDDPDYVPLWLQGCAQAGIKVEPLSPAQALREEPYLNPQVREVYRVPDASCDSWELLHALVQGAAALGGRTLTYHQVTGIGVHEGRVKGARILNRRTGESLEVEAQVIVNAAGPWAGEVGKLAGVKIGMSLSKGIMIAMNTRWTNVIINRLDKPGDGDILVPVGTVAVIGTTSVAVDHPDDRNITPKEVSQMLDAGEVMIPTFRMGRALRAWAGVRPLYDPGGAVSTQTHKEAHDEHIAESDDEGRFITRTFTSLDHADQGVEGMLTIVGGKLTTYRQMAEKISDQVCRMFKRESPCRTAETELPTPEWLHGGKKHHTLPRRLQTLEHAATHKSLICECEIVTRTQLEHAIHEGGAGVSLDDLRRDLRVGMGPCQGGFCAYRTAGVLQELTHLSREQAAEALRDFVEERFRGNRPLLWGHQLRQALLDESIYRRSLGLAPNPAPEGETKHG